MTVKICIGSSCHLKGSYGVVEAMRELLREYDVEELVDLQASFCMGHCAEGVMMRAEDSWDGSGDVFIHGANEENIKEKFLKEIYPKIIPQ